MPFNWFRGSHEKQTDKGTDLKSLVDRFLRLISPEEMEAFATAYPIVLSTEALFLLREKSQAPPPGIQPGQVLEHARWLLARQNRGQVSRAVTETTQQAGPHLQPKEPSQHQFSENAPSNHPAAHFPEHLRDWISEIASAKKTPDNSPAILQRCEKILADSAIHSNNLAEAAVLNVKATACFMNLRGDIRENLERGLQALEQAARLVKRSDLPELWADIQANTGLLYLFRLKFDSQQNLVKAIAYFEASLLVFDAEAHAEAYASAHNNLGTAHFRRIAADGSVNTGVAIQHYQQALAAINRDQYPELWGDIHNNLAGVYSALATEPASEPVRQAEEHYRLALQTLTDTRSRQKYAQTNFNLAWLLLQQSRLSNTDLENALLYTNRALEAAPYQAWPELWGKLRIALGKIHGIRSNLQSEEVEAAELNYRKVLDLFTPETHPSLCLTAALQCGELFFRKNQFARARKYLKMGHAALEAIRAELVTDLSKRETAQKAATLYPLLVRCCLLENDITTAYEYASAAKGRAFIETLEGIAIDLEGTAGHDPQFVQLRHLQQQISDLRRELIHGDSAGDGANDREPDQPPGQVLAQIRSAMRGMNELWEELLLKYPLLQTAQPSRPLSAVAAVQLARKLSASLVEFVDTEAGWGAFVFTDNLHYIPLPELTRELINRLTRWLRTVEQPSGRGGLSYKPLRELYQAVFEPLESFLDPARPLILAPSGPLHMAPLAAAQNAATGQFAGEIFRLGFAPNLNALNILAQKHGTTSAVNEHSLQFLGIAWPGQLGSPMYLEEVRQEVETIGLLFSHTSLLLDQSATVSGVLQQAPDHQFIHFGCHGWFEREFPEQSGVMLADGWLTIYHILSQMHLHAQLVTVGACLTGQVRVRTGDEFTGLTQALLSSGAGAVASSLWSVHDQATRIFFENSYALIAGGASICDAMQSAAQIVRQHPGWQHPYYWAAFQVSGLSMAGLARPAETDLNPARTTNNSVSSYRAGGLMHISALIINIQSVIEEINENPDEVLAAVAPAQHSQFLQAMADTAAEASDVADEPELYQWATRFFAILEQYPAVKALLLEDGASMVSEIQRKISQTQFSTSATQSEQAQQSAVQMRNAVLDCREKLLQSIRGSQTTSSTGTPPDVIRR